MWMHSKSTNEQPYRGRGGGFIGVDTASFIIAPAIMIGREMYLEVGLMSAIVTGLIGVFILYKLAKTMLGIATDKHLGTMDIIRNCFGPNGMLLCAFVICGACMSWFLWQVSFCSQFLSQHVLMIPWEGNHWAVRMTLLVVFLGFWIPSLFGERSLFIMNKIVTPLLLTSFCLCIFFFTKLDVSIPFVIEKRGLNISELSTFLNAWLIYTINLPSFNRNVHSVTQVHRNVKALYLGVLPLVCLLGILQGLFFPTKTLTEVGDRFSDPWQINLTIYVLLGGLAICYVNLIYGADAIVQVFSLRSCPQILVLMGLFSFLFLDNKVSGSFGPSELFKMMTLSILVIIAVRSSTQSPLIHNDRMTQIGNCKALLGATGFGFISRTGLVSMTGVPSFDAALTAFVLSIYYSQSKFRRKSQKNSRKVEKTRRI